MKYFFITIFLFFSFIFINAQNLPELTGRVVDQAGVLSDSEKSNLETFLTKYEAATDHQMVIAIINNLEGNTIEDYTIKLAEKWKIGNTNIDDGIIILVSINDRKIRIEVGYGLEGDMPDALANTIILNDIQPNFRENNYYKGLLTASYKIAMATGATSSILEQDTSKVTQKYKRAADKNAKDKDFSLALALVIFFLIGAFLGSTAKKIFHDFNPILLLKIIGGIVASIIGFFIMSILAMGLGIIILAIVAGFVGLFFAMLQRQHGSGGGGGFFFFGGGGNSGGGFFGGGGDSDGGGFFGGGGDFGGGGAGGDW